MAELPPGSPRRVRAALAAMAAVVLVAGLAMACASPTPTLSALPSVSATPDPSDLFAAAGADDDDAPAPVAPGAPVDPSGPARQANGNCSGQWQHPDTTGPILGTSGGLLTFNVAVEVGVPVSVDEFTRLIDATLGSARSWVGAGNVRLRRVPGGTGANFTIHLACPWTAYSMCASGGLNIKVNGYPYTSCRVGNWVVINSDRYLYGASAVMAAGGALSDYRNYLINHEVGHRLGHEHEHCPGAGQLAPVMQQQTLRMEGCLPNSWPFPWNPLSGATVYPGPAPTTAADPTTEPAPSTEPDPTPAA